MNQPLKLVKRAIDEVDTTVDFTEFPILYVDDEQSNLVTFRFALEDQFRILTAESGEVRSTG
mgnify:CR=1 FL=1